MTSAVGVMDDYFAGLDASTRAVFEHVRDVALAAAPEAHTAVVHDAARPFVTRELVEACVGGLTGVDGAIAASPVTDTVKVIDGGLVGDTLDRDSLVAVASPLVVPAAVVAGLARRPVADLARAVADFAAAGHPVMTVTAPPEARRVASLEDVRLLGALTTAQG